MPDNRPSLWTWKFWKQTLERVIGTFAQSWLAAATVGNVDFMDVSIGWKQSLAVGGMGALYSLAKCVIAVTVGAPDSPSLVNTDS